MAAIPGPFTLTDFVVIDGLQSPGVARISGAALKRTFDKRKGYGNTGATSIYTGKDLTEFDVTFEFRNWKGGDRDDWIDFAKRVFVQEPTTKKGTKTSAAPKALRFEHWQINDPPISVTAVNVLEVGQPDTTDETGLVTVKVKFQEYRPASSGLGKPTGTKVPGVTKQPTAQDAADLQIQALVKTLKEEVAKP